LDECRQFNAGQSSEAQLQDATVRLGFSNVIDAFHSLASRDLPKRFFLDERQTAKGVRLTDEFRRLTRDHTPEGLLHETEARWRLVETAWELGLARSLVTYDQVSRGLFVDRGQRRTSVTSCRDALNGYQKGHCFYCYAPISIVPGDATLADVDHAFPHALKAHLPGNVDGIWNLVLACPACNRGQDGKFDQIPSIRLLSRLHARNEYLIQSHHPLRETLMLQTGSTTAERVAFLQVMHTQAKQVRVHDWEPQQRGRAMFDVS
jgi:5-methylcytosine-specific restriction endonuclease McrA